MNAKRGSPCFAHLPWLVLLCAAALIVPGCRDDRRHTAAEEIEITGVPPPVPDSASPAEVVGALLDAMKSLQDIRQAGLGKAGNRDAYNRSLGTILSLLAQDRVYQRIADIAKKGASTIPRDVSRGAALRLVAESWVSMLAHYTDGFPDAVPDGQLSEGGDAATVRVRVDAPRERAILEKEILPQVTAERGNGGAALTPGSPAYVKRVRELALARGFNVPVAARVSFQLRKTRGRWRVVHMALGPVPEPVGITAPAATSGPAPGA